MTTVTDNYRRIAQSATVEQIAMAMNWYNDAQSVAEEISYILADREFDVTIEHAAAIISAFSPRQRWSVNVRHAIEFAEGNTPKTLGNNVKMAQSAIHEGIQALKGQKTNAFAKAIAGDPNAITIDVWMLKAAGLDRNDTNKTIYAELSKSVTEVAEEFAMTPRDMQALIWIVFRGSEK